MSSTQERPSATRRRGRPPSPEKTQQTQRAILEAATALFLEKGFAAARMEEIGQRANVAKGTLYLYYPTKFAVLEAVVREVIDPIVDVSAVPFNDGETVQAFLRRTLPRLFAGKTREREDMLRLIVSEATRFPEVGAIYRRLVVDPMHAFLQRLAARALGGGELRSGSDALVRFPFLLVAPGLMATVWNALHGPKEQLSVAAAIEAMLDLIFVEETRS